MSKLTVRLTEKDDAALDQLVEDSDEWGNRSDAVRGLIRQAASGDVAADGGPVETERYTPDDRLLAAVYDAALATCEEGFELPPVLLSSVAQTVNNDSAVGMTPDAEAVERYLRRLQQRGFAYLDVTTNIHGESRSRWRIKPPAAVPEAWKWNAENVSEHRDRRREQRSERVLSRGVGES